MTSPSRHTKSPVSQSLLRNKTWDLSFISLLISNDSHKVTPPYSHPECYFMMSHLVTLRWSHLVIIMWLSLEDSILLSSKALRYDESTNNVTMKSDGDFQETMTVKLLLRSFGKKIISRSSLWNSSQICYHDELTMESPNHGHTIVTR